MTKTLKIHKNSSHADQSKKDFKFFVNLHL